MALTLVTLSGTYVKPGSNPPAPATGTVSFTLSSSIQDTVGNVILAPAQVDVPLIAGAFTVTLPAVDDAGVSPSGVVYNVLERIDGTAGRSYALTLSTTATTVNLADLAPAIAGPLVTSYALQATVDANFAKRAAEYVAGRAYIVGELVLSAGTLYRTATAHTAGATINLTNFAAVGGGGGAVADATATTKGVIQLAGDLGGTAALPTVPGLAIKAATTDPRFTDTRVPTDASVTDAKVAAAAAINLDKTADSATRLAFLAAERTKLTGVATGATANSTDAFLLARLNHTGTQAAGTITGLGTAATANTGVLDGEVPLLGVGGRLAIARVASGTPTGALFVRDDGVLAAPAGGGGASPVPFAMTSAGRYTQVGYGAPITGGAAATFNEITYTPFIADKAMTLDRIGVEVTTAAAAAAPARIAIYADADGKPGALVLDCGAIDAMTVGVKELIVNQALTSGRYWLAYWWAGVSHQIRLNPTSIMAMGTTTTALLTSNYTYLGAGAPAATASIGGQWDKCPRFLLRTV